jgi:prophage regulatory protein
MRPRHVFEPFGIQPSGFFRGAKQMNDFVRFKELQAVGIPWSRVHVDRLEKAGKFPRRVRLGTNTVAWIRAEIEALKLQQIAARAA